MSANSFARRWPIRMGSSAHFAGRLARSQHQPGKLGRPMVGARDVGMAHVIRGIVVKIRSIWTTGISLALAMTAMPAVAHPIVWTFTGVVMNEGRAVTGDFVYDADTLKVSNFTINTYATLGGADYGYSFAYDSGNTHTVVSSTPSTGTNIQFIQNADVGTTSPPDPVAATFDLFSAELTDAGGVLPLAGSRTAEYLNSFPSQSIGFNPYGVGSIVASGSVPEPATWALMLCGVGMIGRSLRMSRGRRTMALTA